MAMAVAVVVSGCSRSPWGSDPQIGELTFHNDSDRVVLLVYGTSLEEAVKEEWMPNPNVTRPGDKDTFGFEPTAPRPPHDEPWCAPATYWILADLSAAPDDISTLVELPLDLDELDVLEEIGPGHCWPGRVADFHFEG